MIQQATYSDGSRTATIKIERVDTWVEDPDSIVNFPGIVELEGDLLFLPYSRSRHGAEHETDDPARAAVSHDAGATWSEVPRDSLMATPDPRSGEMQPLSAWSLGYLRDGTIVGIDHSPQSVHDKVYDRAAGHLHEQYQEENPAFRLHRWRRDGTAIESSNFSVAGMPWERASYQAYASILELDDGDLLAALEWVSMLPESEWTYDGRGRAWKYLFGVFIIRSSDGGKTWEFVTKFDPAEVKPTYGISDRGGRRGLRRGRPGAVAQRRPPLRDAQRVILAVVPVALVRRRTDVVDTDQRGLASGQAASPSAAQRSGGLRIRARRLRPSTGHARDAEPGRQRRALGGAVLLPHGSRMLLHLDHAEGRQAARDLFALRLHARLWHAPAADSANSTRRAGRLSGVTVRYLSPVARSLGRDCPAESQPEGRATGPS